MKRRYSYVYILFRPWDGSPFYVGKGKGKRIQSDQDHSAHNKYFANIVKKAKRLGLEIPRVKIRGELTDEEASSIEVAFIRAIGRKEQGSCLVNMTDGGEGVINLSKKSRVRISKATKERMADPKARALISEANRTRQADPAVRKVLSLRMQALHQDPVIGQLIHAAHKGHTHSSETKRKIGDKAKVRMQNPKARERISLSLVGSISSKETKAKQSRSHKRYWERRKQLGLSLARPARDEAARCKAISEGMKRYREQQRVIHG